MLFWHGIPYGVDFRGGTLVYVKFSHTPDENALRAAMDRAGLHNAKIQSYGQAGGNQELGDPGGRGNQRAGAGSRQIEDYPGAGEQCSGGQGRPEQRQLFDNQELSYGQGSVAPG